jgi:DNA-binding NarL/FixJ family response regulator
VVNEYERLTVVIADPQPVMRIGLYTLLESYAVCVVGEAAGPAAAAELVATLKPAVVLIAPGRHGISMHLSAWDRLRELPAPIVAYLSRSSEAPAAALAGVDS